MTLAVVETIAANFGDNSMLVLSNDSLTTVGTDFIFDAKNAATFAGGALPSNGATAFSLVNLARDTAPAIPRASVAVTAAQFDTNLTTYDTTKGFVSFPTTTIKDGLLVQKTGVANNRVCEPTLEGFVSFLLILWMRLNANPTAAQAAMLLGQSGGLNPNAGFYLNTGSANVLEVQTNQVIGNIGAAGALHQVAAHYSFNVGAGTTTVSTFLDGAQVATGIAGRAIASYVANNSNARTRIGGGQGFGIPDMNWCRAVRELTGVSGVDPLAFVAKDYAANLARLS